jgi:murein hydrolase activator
MRRLLPIVLIALPAIAYAQQPVISPSTIDALEKRLSMLDKEIDTEKKELADIGPRRVAAAMRVRMRGRILYKMMRAGLMPLGGGFNSFVDHAQRVERLKHAIKIDMDEEQNLGARAKTLSLSLDTLNKEKTEVSEKKQILDAAKVAIDEEKRRREAFERAFGTSIGVSPLKNDGEIVVYGPSGKMSPESIDPGSFKARKGRLTFPVTGQAEVKAMTKEGGPGVEIKASLGAAVRAAHAGRVAFADRYGTYGQLVILDHGDRCYTVSANLGTIDVKVGDELSAGEKIGTVGDDGRGPSLYFEVRIGNDKVPPAAWLGL